MASSDVVYRMNPDWTEMRQLRGRDFIADTEEPSRTWLQKYIHPDDQSRVLAAIDKAIRTKGIFELEHRVCAWTAPWAGVSRVPSRCWTRTAKSSNGWAPRAISPNADATKRRFGKANGCTGPSASRSIMVCGCAPPTAGTTYASESFLKLVGMTQQQCSDFGWGEVLHPDDAARTIAAWQECVRTGGTWDIRAPLPWCGRALARCSGPRRADP